MDLRKCIFGNKYTYKLKYRCYANYMIVQTRTTFNFVDAFKFKRKIIIFIIHILKSWSST